MLFAAGWKAAGYLVKERVELISSDDVVSTANSPKKRSAVRQMELKNQRVRAADGFTLTLHVLMRDVNYCVGVCVSIVFNPSGVAGYRDARWNFDRPRAGGISHTHEGQQLPLL